MLARRLVTPNMLRLTLGGAAMDTFPPGQAGGYVKLRLSDPGGKVAVRTYTIRAQRADAIDVDFALHADTATGHAGPATDWAQSVAEGSSIEAGGPGAAKPLPPGADFYLSVGDMTALPAIAVNLAALPADARGMAVIEVMSEADQQDLDRPAGVGLRWVITPQPGSGAQALADAVRAVDLPSERLYVWSACEFGAMHKLRAYFRDELGLTPDRLYISSYWKSGFSEDDHKLAKREDAEAQAG